MKINFRLGIYIFIAVLLTGIIGSNVTNAQAVHIEKNDNKINLRLIEKINRHDLRGVDRLLKLGADPNCRDHYGFPALTVSLYDGFTRARLLDFALHTHNHAIALLLLNHGANINGLDSYGRTALMEMANLGSISEANFLINKGASVHATDKGGATALHWAALNYLFMLKEQSASGQKRSAFACSVAETLIRHGADVNAMASGETTPVLYGGTPLMYASLLGNSRMVSCLLSAGANVSETDASGLTALMMAIRSIDHATVYELLRHHANPNQASKSGFPLLWAISMQQADLVKLLLQFGADPKRQFLLKDHMTSALEAADAMHLKDIGLLLRTPVNRPNK